MKQAPLFVIKNIHTGHFFCESKYNWCTNKKYAKTFSGQDAAVKQKELKEFFDCEVEPMAPGEAEGKEAV